MTQFLHEKKKKQNSKNNTVKPTAGVVPAVTVEALYR